LINNLVNLTSYDPTEVTLTETPGTIESIVEFDNFISAAKGVDPINPFRYGSFYLNKLNAATD